MPNFLTNTILFLIFLFKSNCKKTNTSTYEPAIFKVNTIQLNNSTTKDVLVILHQNKRIKFKGYLIYNENSEGDDKQFLKNEYQLKT